MKKAVMYGSGKIGRGFIGQKMHKSGYEVSFLDAVPALVDAINDAGEYSVFVVSNDGERRELVENVHAYLADSPEARDEIAACDLMATAVGVRNLECAARNIAEAIEIRSNGGAPLNIIMAENQLDVDRLMREYICQYLSDDARRWADENLGIIAASIQRMVPVTDAAHLEHDPLAVVTEAFSDLPVDKDAFRGGIPELAGLLPFAPFSFHEKRKLFMHNMAHALSAYLGYLRGYTYIWEAIADEEIREKTRVALYTVADALAKEYGVPSEELRTYAEDLLTRFANRPLGDTVIRVGADPVRKLRMNDRLTGAAVYAEEQGLDPEPILAGIAAGLCFDPPDDKNAAELQNAMRTKGFGEVLKTYTCLEPDSKLGRQIAAEYQAIASERSA